MQKAIVAILSGALVVLNEFFGVEIGIDEPTLQAVVNTIFVVLGALGVYMIPNR